VFEDNWRIIEYLSSVNRSSWYPWPTLAPQDFCPACSGERWSSRLVATAADCVTTAYGTEPAPRSVRRLVGQPFGIVYFRCQIAMLAKAGPGIRFNEHMQCDGETVLISELFRSFDKPPLATLTFFVGC
jgi:hypothetical protein